MKPTKTLSDAQRNLAKLPAQCFGIVLGNPVGSRISIIKAGETGYYRTNEPQSFRAMTEAELNVEVNRMNAEDKVTPQQRSAMENGSMFGWGCGSADPDHRINSLRAAKHSTS